MHGKTRQPPKAKALGFPWRKFYEFFHVTPERNLPRIMSEGLRPMIGQNSAAAAEEEPAVYLFGSIDDAETAILNWLGELFEEEEELVILSVRLTDVETEQLKHPCGYEWLCEESIPSERVSIQEKF